MSSSTSSSSSNVSTPISEKKKQFSMAVSSNYELRDRSTRLSMTYDDHDDSGSQETKKTNKRKYTRKNHENKSGKKIKSNYSENNYTDDGAELDDANYEIINDTDVNDEEDDKPISSRRNLSENYKSNNKSFIIKSSDTASAASVASTTWYNWCRIFFKIIPQSVPVEKKKSFASEVYKLLNEKHKLHLHAVNKIYILKINIFVFINVFIVVLLYKLS